jgi:hypothetical protein
MIPLSDGATNVLVAIYNQGANQYSYSTSRIIGGFADKLKPPTKTLHVSSGPLTVLAGSALVSVTSTAINNTPYIIAIASNGKFAIFGLDASTLALDFVRWNTLNLQASETVFDANFLANTNKDASETYLGVVLRNGMDDCPLNLEVRCQASFPIETTPILLTHVSVDPRDVSEFSLSISAPCLCGHGLKEGLVGVRFSRPPKTAASGVPS